MSGEEIPAWEHGGVQQIPLEPGEWVKVEFWGYVSREGAVDGATVYLRAELEPLLERLREAMGFAEVRDLSLSRGKLYEDAPDVLPPSVEVSP